MNLLKTLWECINPKKLPDDHHKKHPENSTPSEENEKRHRQEKDHWPDPINPASERNPKQKKGPRF